MKKLYASLLLSILLLTTSCSEKVIREKSGATPSVKLNLVTQFKATQEFDFEINGPRGENDYFESDPIYTDSILKAQLHAPTSGELVVNTDQDLNLNFSCVRYRVTLYNLVGNEKIQNGEPIITSMLRVGDAPIEEVCADSSSQEVVDFSDRLSGPHPYLIEVSDVAYDFYCQLWHYYFFLGYDPTNIVGAYNMTCPMKPVHRTHSISGKMDIQANGAGN